MKKRVLQAIFFCSILIWANYSYSQDIIVFNNGDETKSKVFEVTINQIKYKKWGNLDGPIYSASKAEVFMIKYANGTKDVFKSDSVSNKNSGDRNAVKIAEAYLNSVIKSNSKQMLTLIDFSKTNGISKIVDGQKVLEIEFEIITQFVTDASIFQGLIGTSVLLGSWLDFELDAHPSNAPFGGYNDGSTQFFGYRKGTKVKHVGTITLEDTENGYRVLVYRVKTYAVIHDVNKVSTTKNVISNKAIIKKVTPGYIGDLKKGKKEGIGKQVYSNGSSYEGEWKNNKRNGKGVFIDKDGSIYTGYWKEDEMNGEFIVNHFINRTSPYSFLKKTYVGSYKGNFTPYNGIITFIEFDGKTKRVNKVTDGIWGKLRKEKIPKNER